MDGFTEMLEEALVFFAALAANNTKEWFEPHKDQYISRIRKPAEFLADLLAEDISRMTGVAHKPKVYRIYRDVRFSKDKTPYNAHLHILWSAAGAKDASLVPNFFFGAEPGEVIIGMGIIGMEGPDLARYRAMVDTWGDGLAEAVTEAGGKLSDYGPPALKKVPKPYGADHPQAEYLRRKSLIVIRDLGDTWRTDPRGLARAIRQEFEAVIPLYRFLRERLG